VLTLISNTISFTPDTEHGCYLSYKYKEGQQVSANNIYAMVFKFTPLVSKPLFPEALFFEMLVSSAGEEKHIICVVLHKPFMVSRSKVIELYKRSYCISSTISLEIWILRPAKHII
jgi:hypothetical protein